MPNFFPILIHKSDPCGVLYTPAMSTREVTPGKRPHGKHISSSLPISACKADLHTQQWVIRRDDIFIYFILFKISYNSNKYFTLHHLNSFNIKFSLVYLLHC